MIILFFTSFSLTFIFFYLLVEGVHVGHVIVDGRVDTEYTNNEAFISPDAGTLNHHNNIIIIFLMIINIINKVADVYWNLHSQPSTSWTYELDVRPSAEKW